MTGFGQDRIPLHASAHSKLTVTSVAFQPAALGGGDAAAVIVGGSRSTPTIVIVIRLPGSPRTLTTRWLTSESATFFTISGPRRLKSRGETTSTPFRVMAARAARSRGAHDRLPPLWTSRE